MIWVSIRVSYTAGIYDIQGVIILISMRIEVRVVGNICTPRGSQEFKNYPGSIFFVKALATVIHQLMIRRN